MNKNPDIINQYLSSLPHFYYNADASRQKGDNFRTIMDRVLIGCFDITSGS